MPNIKSAKKRVKVIASNTNADNKQEAVRLATKKIDQAVAKGILHKNTAARSKSNLAKRLNASA